MTRVEGTKREKIGKKLPTTTKRVIRSRNACNPTLLASNWPLQLHSKLLNVSNTHLPESKHSNTNSMFTRQRQPTCTKKILHDIVDSSLVTAKDRHATSPQQSTARTKAWMRPGLDVDEGSGFDGWTYIDSIGPDLDVDEGNGFDGWTYIGGRLDQILILMK